MKVFKLLLLFLLAAAECRAAGVTALQDTAVANRRVVERYRDNLEKAGRDEVVARSPYYPSVDLAFTANQLDDDTFWENRENNVLYGAVRWNVFSGWRDRYGLRAAHWRLAGEAGRLAAIRQDIRLAVALRCLALHTAVANLQVAQDSSGALEKIFSDGEKRFQVGLITRNDLLKFRVDLDNAAITLKKAAAEVARNRRLLSREIGAELGPDEPDFAEFAELPAAAGVEELERLMLARRSELKVLESQAAAAEELTEMEKGGRYPRIDLTGSYRRYEDSLIAGGGDDRQEEFRNQLVVSVNLFDGQAREARIAKAGLESRTVRHDLFELQEELRTELRNLHQDYLVAMDNVAAAGAAIDQAEENLRITRIAYAEGLDTEADLLVAVASLSRARYNLAAARGEVFSSYFRIVRAIEGPVE